MYGFPGIDRLKEIFGYIKEYVEGQVSTLSNNITNNDSKVYYCTCSTTGSTADKIVTVDSGSTFTLKIGTVIAVKFTASNSATKVTLNVEKTGAKSIYYNNGVVTASTTDTCGQANRTILYVYNGTYWVWIGGSYYYTYTNLSLGQGYGTCSTGANAVSKIVTLSEYTICNGGIIAVKFDNDVPANSSMNINSQGLKAIVYRGEAITEGVINAGDIALFMYSSSLQKYILLTVDRGTSSDESLPYSISSTILSSSSWAETTNNGASLEYVIDPPIDMTESYSISISLDETGTLSSEIINAFKTLDICIVKYLSSDSKIHLYSYGENPEIDVPISIEVRSDQDVPDYISTSMTIKSSDWITATDNGATLEYSITPLIEMSESDKILVSLDETKSISSGLIKACKNLDLYLVKYSSSDSKIHFYAYGKDMGYDIPLSVEIRKVG
jgi:hypothetical protein